MRYFTNIPMPYCSFCKRKGHDDYDCLRLWGKYKMWLKVEAQKKATIRGYRGRQWMTYQQYMNSREREMPLPPPQTSNIPHRDHCLHTLVRDAFQSALECMRAKPSGSDSKPAGASKPVRFWTPQPKVKLAKNKPAALRRVLDGNDPPQRSGRVRLWRMSRLSPGSTRRIPGEVKKKNHRTRRQATMFHDTKKKKKEKKTKKKKRR